MGTAGRECGERTVLGVRGWGWGCGEVEDELEGGAGDVEGDVVVLLLPEVFVFDVEVEALLGWWVGCWRMAEKKVERKKGRWEDIVEGCFV